MALSTTIKSIQDIMRKDVGVDGDAQRIGQIAWMLFLKILDDQEAELEALHDDFRSPLPEALRWRKWAADREGMTGEALLSFVNNELFPKLKALKGRGRDDPRARLVRVVFEDAYNYMKSGTLLRQVVNKLNEGIDFNDAKSRHLLGDLYEQILRDLQSAGNAGEFYTPRAVTQFMVERVDPRLGETVLDPACGTGGFLTASLDHVRRHVKKPEHEALLQRSIHGVEKKPLPHLLCTTNLMLHGVEVPLQVRHDNTLARPLRDRGPDEQVDVILTNPPFGGMEEDGVEKNFPIDYQTRETADLFLVLILHLLKPGGRAAVVLPDGTLFGEGIKSRIKERLLSECDLHTIVRLPKGVFAPYASIQTNLLFFTKGKATKEVWFYDHPYPDGQKSYSKTKPLRLEEFAPERAWWAKRAESDRAWKVAAKDIAARNYNLDWKNPRVVDAAHGDPDELLAKYEAAAREVASVREALRDALSKALLDRRSVGT